MLNKPVALVTGTNQGIGLQIAKDLVSVSPRRMAQQASSRVGKTKQFRGDGAIMETRSLPSSGVCFGIGRLTANTTAFVSVITYDEAALG